MAGNRDFFSLNENYISDFLVINENVTCNTYVLRHYVSNDKPHLK